MAQNNFRDDIGRRSAELLKEALDEWGNIAFFIHYVGTV
jgi:hypothetical protein